MKNSTEEKAQVKEIALRTNNMSEIRLNSSKLGTQEYWNDFYKREIENFDNDSDDTGECWFDDSDAEMRMVQFLIEKINDGLFREKRNISIIDLGTGNGHLLFHLQEELEEDCERTDVTFSFRGIDYSPDSVNFSISIQKKRKLTNFQFDQVDLLAKENAFLQANEGKYEIMLDKGTLDAIALNNDPLADFDNKIGLQVYTSQVSKLLHPGSVFLVTSCNFTESELTKIITEEGSLEVWDKINYKTFEFGGVKGSTICSIAFVKK